MALQSAPDIPLLITSATSSSERRVTPSWSIAHFRTRLEPITGIPATAQKLSLRVGTQEAVAVEAADEDRTQLAAFPLQAYAEVHVVDTRPSWARTDFSDVSAVEKYTMPSTEYETRSDSVLAWKKAQKLGRFDPNAPSIEEQKIRALEREVEERGLTLSTRVRLLPASDARRGTIRYIGPVPQLPGLGPWVGVALDEPTGKNDGSVKGTRYFEAGANQGAFVRPERCEAGEWAVLGLDGLEEDEEM